MWVSVKSIVAGDVIYYVGDKYTVKSASHMSVYSYLTFEGAQDSVRFNASAQVERVI